MKKHTVYELTLSEDAIYKLRFLAYKHDRFIDEELEKIIDDCFEQFKKDA